MVDEHSLTAILIQHFPQARHIDIADAARDLVLLDLLADDRVPVWEDSMRAGGESEPPQVFVSNRLRES